MRTQISDAFVTARHAVIHIPAGRSALPLLREYPWDIAVLDVGENTTELCRAIRADNHLRVRFVVALTGGDEMMVDALEAGADDAVVKPACPRQMLARFRAVERIVELKKNLLLAHEKLERAAITDGLTGVYSRQFFQEKLASVFRIAGEHQSVFSVAMIDVDRFKRVNDAHGHTIGDDVLIELSNLFVQSIRPTDVLARYGGEEFALLMPEIGARDAANVAERLRRMVETTPIAARSHRLPLTVSVGVAAFSPGCGGSPAELLNCADDALYRAKRRGRNRVNIARRRTAAMRDDERPGAHERTHA